MFGLLRRSKNRRSLRQDDEILSNFSPPQNAKQSQNQNQTNQSQPQPQRPPRMHGKYTSAIEALEDFDDLDGESTTKETKQTTADEREAYFAKIYFENNEKQNVNLANSTPVKRNAASSASSSKVNNFESSGVSVSVGVSGGGGSVGSSSASSVPNSATFDESAKEKNTNSAIRKTTRRSLGFRQVDLDGINSIIEAIILDDDDDNDEEESKKTNDNNQLNHGDHCDHNDQVARPAADTSEFVEHSGIVRGSLSQNERAELSGHVPSQSWSSSLSQSGVCSNDQKRSIVFNKSEISATNSNGAGHVRSAIQDETTTTTGSNIAIDGSTSASAAAAAATSVVVVTSSEEPSNNNIKQIKAARRRSYFQRKSNEPSTVSESSDQLKSNSKNINSEAVQDNHEVIKKTQGPLQKGKKILSNIFMARGRHHPNQRNRNQTVQQQSVVGKQLQQQQQQQKTCANTYHAAVTTDHNNCQNATSNEEDSTISDTRNSFTASNQNGTQTSTMLRQHLETTNSPIRQRDPAASNQMTLSNNSLKNASRRDVLDEGGLLPHQMRNNARGSGVHQYRSNSAEQHRERGEHQYLKSVNAVNGVNGVSNGGRAYSEEPQGDHRRWPGAGSNNARASFEKEQSSSSSLRSLNNANTQEARIIRARNIEQNGVSTENPADGVINYDQGSNGQLPSNEREKSQELTACARDRSQVSPNQQQQQQKQQKDAVNRKNCVDAPPMGQTYGKNEIGPEQSRASTPREFRESFIPEIVNGERPTVVVPKITVVDCSAGNSAPYSVVPGNDSPTDQEIFYDFESENHKSSVSSVSTNKESINSNGVDIEDVDSDIDDEVFHEQVSTSQTTATYNPYRQHSPRHSPSKLEDVPEQEEDESLEDDADDHCRSRHHNSTSVSPERCPLKSSDSNLSNSYPDSGISGCSEPQQTMHSEHNNASKITTKSTSRVSQSQSQSSQPHRRQRSPFVRDSTSTDCDDTLLQCDDLDCFASPSPSTSASTSTLGGGDRLVCIESISLPDVVESTTSSSPGGGNGPNAASSNPTTAGTSGEQIININGATGNSMGNVHFIPIHIEGERNRGTGSGGIGNGNGNGSSGGSAHRANSPNQQQKRRSIDDSVIGNGMNSTRFTHFNDSFELSNKPTIEIIEEDENTTQTSWNTEIKNAQGINAEKLRLEIQEQKSRFSVQLEDAQKNVQNLQTKINEMQTKIGNLEQELSMKTWNVERLQSELNATQREDEFVRKKLRLLEEEKTDLRHKYSENEDEFRRKHSELEKEYKELEEKYKNSQQLASNLQTQLAAAQTEAEQWRVEVAKIRSELEEQNRILQNALDNSEAERKICEDKWQKEFEMLRTQHMDREETLMTDCEWQLRQTQRQWKDKLDKSEHLRRDAVDKNELIVIELEARKEEVENLRVYEAEVKSLRSVISEQTSSIQSLMDQIENLKSELRMANEKLEDQIEAVKKIKFQCDNTLCDKERQMVYRIDEIRNEAACFWENKLYTEMTRLKNELESVYVDERREALDKLQAEHIEELRALTTRYTANEEELRTELTELTERFDNKSGEFLELRQKSDNALLQTRMHLDRADREYQNAMCREEERREVLEESLRKEFETEKQEMETKFRERLEQVKEEFANELQISKQEMSQKHQKELEQQRAKLRAEKDEALQEMAERHRLKLATAEDRMKDVEIEHQRDLKDLKATYDEDKAVLDKRDMSNANEIEQLHRRCRCLTNLFEEMRMRYERRDPRPEDLREIEELRTRCESQERDLFTLTTSLREMQLQMSTLQQNDKGANSAADSPKKNNKSIQKPPPKTIPTNCDVIYEENEERDSPPPEPLTVRENLVSNGNNVSDDEENEENDDTSSDDDSDSVVDEAVTQPKLTNGTTTVSK